MESQLLPQLCHPPAVGSQLPSTGWYTFSFLLQGLYVFVVYFIMHNQMCCPMKASYTVEVNGHPGPSTAFFTPGSGMPPAGGEISKSTQNLISALEEVRK